MTSPYFREVAKAETYNRTLRADDPRLQRSVTIVHADGSVLHYRHALLMQSGEYLAVFTEHHGFHVYHVEDLRRYEQSDTVPIQQLP